MPLNRTEKKKLRLAAAKRKHTIAHQDRMLAMADRLIWNQRVRMARPPRWAHKAAEGLLGLMIAVYIAILIGSAAAGC